MSASPPSPFADLPWKRVAVPQAAVRVPTMLTDEEGQLLYWLARDYAQGAGAVCDLGCFAGGSTARLAAGVADAGRTTSVHAYDHFLIQEPQKDRYLYSAGIAPFRGHDMLPAVRQMLAPWRALVDFHKGDIRETGWPGGPVELLFIDAAKTPQTADVIAGVFMPHLIPGRSVVIHQDYQHWRQPWVPAQMELLAPCFELVGWCHKGTAVFRCTEPVTPERLVAARTTGLDDAALRRLLVQAIRRFPGRPQTTRLACTILALEDNPGERLSYRLVSKGFSPDRVARVLAEV